MGHTFRWIVAKLVSLIPHALVHATMPQVVVVCVGGITCRSRLTIISFITEFPIPDGYFCLTCLQVSANFS